MPTTAIGLIVAVVLLVPGFIHYTQRRARVPLRSMSPLVETANLITVSTFTNALALCLFAVGRSLFPEHTPDVQRLVQRGWQYAEERLPYLGAWALALLAVSSGLALILGVRPKWIAPFSARFAPTIVDVPAWYQTFEHEPDKRTYVGIDLHDGSYVGGFLDWYSTELEETADRDLVLAEPLQFRPPGDEEDRPIEGFSRLIISARDIHRLYVSYIDQPTDKS